ncbi:Rne/Rng family ribonuclease [Prosthecomicrobium sp. N25]|uniref:Rne/Rng family ribonuclease n=1 Tax=Prosthecomicrobium sp. N25 TaxID=3129254 RepID=UPI003077F7AC
MANKMLIDATHPEETRVVVVRGSRVEEFDFEAASKKQLRGNIYLAKVTRVEPSLQAAFVDYGGNRHGFLAFSEIHPDYYQIPVADRQALLEEEARMHSAEDREDARPRRQKAQAAASNGDEASEDAENEEDQVESVGSEDALEELPERRSAPRLKRSYKIQEVIKRRQVLLVQVVKEERGNKGAALTTYLSLAGRYSVLMPNTARGGGISRKITQPTDRKRLKKIAQELEVPEGMGVIVRTAGAARTKAEIKRDFEYLLRLWENVRELTLKSTAPKLVYEEGSLIKRSIRDLYNKDIDEILVSGDDGYREAKDFMRMLMPSHAKNVQQYKEPTPVFTRFGVESQLDAMFSPQVVLRSGGYIVINQTEALVSIDVNSGKSTREHNIEDTALQTNLEAAEEVARQLRLRDLAGLIVIDFIDMEEKRNNRSVERKLKDCLKNDRARIQVGRISHFGLLEMSRQRIRTGVLESSMIVCPHCGGTGMVRSTESVALHVLRSLEEALIKNVTHDLIVRTRTTVALYILNQKRGHLSDLERRFGLDIAILADDHASMGGHLFVVEKGDPVTRAAEPRPQALVTPQSIEPEDEVYEEPVEEDEDEEAAEPPRSRERDRDRDREREGPREARAEGEDGGRRRRRRRRRGRGRNGEEVRPGAPQAQGAVRQDDVYEAGESYEGDEGEEAEGEDEAMAGAEGERASAEGDRNGEGRKRRRRGRRGGRRNRREGGEGGETTAGSDMEFGGAEDESDEGGEETAGAVTGGEATGGVTAEPAEPVADGAGTEAVGVPVEAAAETVPDVLVVDRETLTAEVEEGRKAKKPAKPRSRKKAVAAEPAAEVVAETPASEPEAAATEAAAPAPAPAPADDADAERPAAEPELAEVAEVPQAAARPIPSSTEVDPSKPKRSGWWARKS